MPQLKTKENDGSVNAFLQQVEPERKREDSIKIKEMMEEAVGEAGTMWGSNIVGFGHATITYADGSTADWMKIGFSPRKQSITLYLDYNYAEGEELLAKLGKHKIGRSCLYINKLADVDIDVLKQLIAKNVH